MTRSRLVSSLVWVAAICVAIVIVARAKYTADLSAFLPQSPTPTQRLLVDQLRDGVASRLIIIGLEGGDAAARARVSSRMAAAMRADQRFTSVSNGEQAGLDKDREYLFDHRYVLSESVTPDRFTAAGLESAVQDSLDLLASPIGMLAKELLPRDPTGEMVQILDQVSGGQTPRTAEGVWVSKDGRRALIVVQTRANGSDTEGQQSAIAAIEAAFTAAQATRPQAGPTPVPAAAAVKLDLTGPGVFSVNARNTIEHEAIRLSLLSTGLIVLLLLAVYRSLPALVLGMVPVATGALAGIAAVQLGFGVVHGLTLGFGITLIGESVDYSIYLFIQSRRAWTTIGLGVLTSICGFAALLPSTFQGVAQLGLYSIVGLTAAALVTRYVLPNWLPANFAVRDVAPLGAGFAAITRRLRRANIVVFLIPVAAGLVLYLHWDSMWNRDIGQLSPLRQEDLDRDARLRGDIGAPDVRYLVVVSEASEQALLRTSEKIGAALEPLIETHAIGGFESPARYLPSEATQQARLASIPDAPELQARLAKALTGMPLTPAKLTQFVADVEAARTGALLRRSDLNGTSLAAGFDSMVAGQDAHWTAILPLHGPKNVDGMLTDIDADQVKAAVAAAAPTRAVVLDVKSAADSLYTGYLSQVVHLSLYGLAAIVVLLLIALRSLVRVARVVAPLALAVLCVAAGLIAFGGALNILHVIGMLLIVAVGSNYALFFDRRARERDAAAEALTLASLIVANAATVLGFGVLATSSVPVLSALGSTVAPGALLALVFSALLAEDGPAGPRGSTLSTADNLAS